MANGTVVKSCVNYWRLYIRYYWWLFSLVPKVEFVTNWNMYTSALSSDRTDTVPSSFVSDGNEDMYLKLFVELINLLRILLPYLVFACSVDLSQLFLARTKACNNKKINIKQKIIYSPTKEEFKEQISQLVKILKKYRLVKVEEKDKKIIH